MQLTRLCFYSHQELLDAKRWSGMKFWKEHFPVIGDIKEGLHVSETFNIMEPGLFWGNKDVW
jgi:hypothetical protein